jgi:hypothetical protein
VEPARPFWLTRDSSSADGALSDKVDIWLARPRRASIGLGAAWMVDDAAHYFGFWSLAEAGREVRNGVPDNDRECTHAYEASK